MISNKSMRKGVIMQVMKTDLVIDTKGTACPMPVLNTKKALNRIASGQIIEVIADDHGAESDIPVLIKQLGHVILQVIRKDDSFHFFIKKV